MANLYDEEFRPQFHFSPRRNWTNDPNGLVFYAGEYHLFFQHNPVGIDWGNMTWGHAVSRDLVHWEQLANAIEPDALGTVFSGSAVVDWKNTSGFQQGDDPPLVALFTAAGGTSPQSQGQPFTQCAAYSNDRGRTWTRHSGNPVLREVAKDNRDPKVVWHAPSERWVMALFLTGNEYALFNSPNLREWTHLQRIVCEGVGECPDFFEMPVRDERGVSKWVFTGANGRYLVGSFDGRAFRPEEGPFWADRGANFYAVQTWSDVPSDDGRRIQIAWMNGGSYPAMPFNQQMSFPCVLTLVRYPEGLRLCRRPVREIEFLCDREVRWHDVPLATGVIPLEGMTGVLWDIDAEFAVGKDADLALRCCGAEVRYNAAEQTVTCLGRSAPMAAAGGRIRLRVLVDRSSIEVFDHDGRVSLTSCFLPPAGNRRLEVALVSGSAEITRLHARELQSAWRTRPLPHA